MEPFRELLKKDGDFAWSGELQMAFDHTCQSIADKVVAGVKTFVLGRPTAVVTDWSKSGVGFVLLQKSCSCKVNTPLCCVDGWNPIYIGSRFCSGAESRYSAVEGELLGLLWALEKTRFWTLGCPDFTDQKPLVGLVRTVNLDSVGNPRLLPMLERMLRWRFSVTHVPGKKNRIPDALSRYPWAELAALAVLGAESH